MNHLSGPSFFGVKMTNVLLFGLLSARDLPTFKFHLTICDNMDRSQKCCDSLVIFSLNCGGGGRKRRKTPCHLFEAVVILIRLSARQSPRDYINIVALHSIRRLIATTQKIKQKKTPHDDHVVTRWPSITCQLLEELQLISFIKTMSVYPFRLLK